MLVKRNDRIEGPPGEKGSLGPTDAEQFAENLERRRRAANGLQKDLLDDVPLLYGSPDGGYTPDGDPGITLARIHREEMLRRNGYDASDACGEKSEVSLPFERTTAALAILLFLLFLFAKFT
jgi:hypothetical protein